MKRVTWLALVALLAAAVAGFALGFMVGHNASPPRLQQVTLLGVSRSLLLDSLDLTGEQRQLIERVLNDAERSAGQSIDSMMNDVRNTTRQARQRVRDALDANQRAKLDSILSTVSELRPRSPLPPRDTAR